MQNLASHILEAFFAATEGHRSYGTFRVVEAGFVSPTFEVYEDALDVADARSQRTLDAVRIEEFVNGAWTHNTAWIHGLCVESEPERVAALLAGASGTSGNAKN